MKANLLAAFLFISIAASAQYTLIPDVNFEKKLIALNIDSGMPDGKVLTANVSSLQTLDVSVNIISDLKGIESFVNLTSLKCYSNQLATLDISKNTALVSLNCGTNQLISLDVSNNTALTSLECSDNQLRNLDVSKNTALTYLGCSDNQLASLDVSKNTALTQLYCDGNILTSLNLKNGKNTILSQLFCGQNPNLLCIQVDDKTYSDTNWSTKKDATATYSTDCSVLGINALVFEKISIYPNPTKGELHIDNVNLENATVYDASGKTLQTASFDNAMDKNTMNLSGLSKGIYYVFIEAQGAQTTSKIAVE